jgi:nicotinamidase-related amidase
MKALLVIDMQNDFCLPGGLLCVTMALECIPKVKKAVRAARAAGIPVFWILRQHHSSGRGASFRSAKNYVR